MAEESGSRHSQIVSKQRVADHGEVYTRPEEVNAMIDLVWNKVHSIEARFLEPACGTGNFLDTILRRKLEKAKEIPKRRQPDFERAAMTAVSSLYGIELLRDNVEACKNRLYETFVDVYVWRYHKSKDADYLKSIRFILDNNILQGDALRMETVDKDAHPTGDPITFPEWSFATSGLVSRRDYQFSKLIPSENPTTAGAQGQLGLLLEKPDTVRNEIGEDIFIPTTVAEYPPVFYREVYRAY